MSEPAYFVALGDGHYMPTEHVSGAWALDEQHVAPALGILCHVVERDLAARRGPGLLISRLSYDILGTMPLEECSVAVEVIRPGRTIELVEAVMSCAGRVGVRLRAWLLHPIETTEISGTDFTSLPAPTEYPEIRSTDLWPGGFIASAKIRRSPDAVPGRGQVWVGTDLPLVVGEEHSALAGAVGMFDIANGMNVKVDPRTVHFPNVDLTAHLFRHPRRGWLGLDTTVSFGAAGLGLTSSVLHDEDGAFGTLQQSLTVRPRKSTS